MCINIDQVHSSVTPWVEHDQHGQIDIADDEDPKHLCQSNLQERATYIEYENFRNANDTPPPYIRARIDEKKLKSLLESSHMENLNCFPLHNHK